MCVSVAEKNIDVVDFMKVLSSCTARSLLLAHA